MTITTNYLMAISSVVPFTSPSQDAGEDGSMHGVMCTGVHEGNMSELYRESVNKPSIEPPH
jgi:hypothetical protein